MKKIFYLIISFLFLLPPLVFGDAAELEEIAQTIASSSCCPFYNDTNVAWSWCGEHDLGHNYGCWADGTEDDADTDNAITGTSYGEGGDDVGLLIDDATSQYLRWNLDTEDDPIDGGAAQTICMKIYVVSGGITNATDIFRAQSTETTDNMSLKVREINNWLIGYYDTVTEAAYYSTAASLTYGAWKTIAISWQDAGNTGDLSVDPGDGSGYDEDLDDLTYDQTNGINYFTIGQWLGSRPASTEYIYITSFAVVDSYEAACSSLTNW